MRKEAHQMRFIIWVGAFVILFGAVSIIHDQTLEASLVHVHDATEGDHAINGQWRCSTHTSIAVHGQTGNTQAGHRLDHDSATWRYVDRMQRTRACWICGWGGWYEVYTMSTQIVFC